MRSSVRLRILAAYYTSGSNGALGPGNLDGTQNESLIPMAGNLTGIALGELP